MRKFRSHKCPVCGKSYKELGAFNTHMRNEHPGEIPSGWSIQRYTYFLHTGKTAGMCRVCGAATGWNDSTCKYLRICDSPVCKKRFRDEFMANLRKAGKENLMEDPKYREKMLTNRRISGTVQFADGGQVAYMANLEKAFLVMLDKFFRFPSADIIAPSPNRYVYYYDNPNDPEHKGEHIYIPDFYIPSINLEIEVKSAQNARPDNLTIDVVRDAQKDVRMLRDPGVNYIKLYENDFHVFFQVFADFAKQLDDGKREPIKYVSRSLLSSIYLKYIPEDCLKIIRKYIYKYSENQVMREATESDIGYELEDIDETPEQMEARAEDSDDILDAVYGTPEEITEELEDGNEDDLEPERDYVIGLDPAIYYSLQKLSADDPVSEGNEGILEMFNFDEDNQALEGFISGIKTLLNGSKVTDSIDTNTVAGKTAAATIKWKDKLLTTGTIKDAAKYVKVRFKDGRIYIDGINCNLLLYRIKEYYDESRLKHIFEYVYYPQSWKAYQNKSISRGELKIRQVYAPQFFALELVTIFRDLSERYHDKSYEYIATEIYNHSWLVQADAVTPPLVSLEPLKNLRLELLPHQKLFIENWDRLISRLHLNGFVLAFQPGKGKTLTAVGLSECLHASKVYIVCPNNLKENWATEIRKYYAKYDNEQEWRRGVCILGTNFGDPKTARFIITNNESIKLMQAVAQPDPTAMFVLDESHNFRNYNGVRSAELFKLANTIQSHNVLAMSATPIKAAPSEITPVLKLIDPTFTDEAAAMYARCFMLDDVAAMRIIERRFGMIMWRPDNVKVDLPEKHIAPLEFQITTPERYFVSNVNEEIRALYHEIHDKWMRDNKAMIDDFMTKTRQFSKAPAEVTQGYQTWILDAANSLRNSGGYHELTVSEYQQFISDYVRTNPKCPPMEADRLEKIHQTLQTAARSHMGTALGKILPPRRNEMFIKLFKENQDEFISMIRNRSKKTIIFSTMVPVVREISKALTEVGIGCVTITGAVNNRMELIDRFKNDPGTTVLVATSQTLGVGLTLIEASQMFFFGTPWRSTDFEQACDRIYRIGQTEDVDIWKVMMISPGDRHVNLSMRMEEILGWSDRMFNAAISPTDITGEGEGTAQATESHLSFDVDPRMLTGEVTLEEDVPEHPHIQLMRDLYNQLATFQYGYCYGINGRSDFQTEESPGWRTESKAEFLKHKGGTCFDFAMYQLAWLTQKGIRAKNYWIWMGEQSPCHTMTIAEIAGNFYWIELAAQEMKGLYSATSREEIFDQFLYDSYRLGYSKPGKVVVMEVPTSPAVPPALTLKDYIEFITTYGRNVRFFYDPKRIGRLQNELVEEVAVESMYNFDDRWTSQYHAIASEEEGDLLHKIQETYRNGMYHKYVAAMSDNWLMDPLPNHYSLVSTHVGICAFDFAWYTFRIAKNNGLDPLLAILNVENRFYAAVCLIPAFNGCFIVDPSPQPGHGLWFDKKPDSLGYHYFRFYFEKTHPETYYDIIRTARHKKWQVQIYLLNDDAKLIDAAEKKICHMDFIHSLESMTPAVFPVMNGHLLFRAEILHYGTEVTRTNNTLNQTT